MSSPCGFGIVSNRSPRSIHGGSRVISQHTETITFAREPEKMFIRYLKGYGAATSGWIRRN